MPALPRLLRPRLLLVPAVLAALAATGAPAHAAPEPASYETHVTPAEHYAALMADMPAGAAVVVDDALAGEYDLVELEAGLHGSFGAVGVPYHVVASPFPESLASLWAPDMLAALHDRIGADGIYVHLRPDSGIAGVRAYGVDLPVDLADQVTRGETEYGAPLGEVAAAFTEALTASEEDLLRRSDAVVAAREAGEDTPSGWEEFVEDLDPSRSVGPENLGLIVGAPVGALVTMGAAWAVVRVRRGAGTRSTVLVAAVATLVPSAAAVAWSLAHLTGAPPGPQELPDPLEEVRAEPPYVASTARVERVVGQMGEERLYVDPLTPLPREGLAEVAARLEEAPAPVRAVVLPMAGSDESAGDPHVFLHAWHHALGEDGVYAVVTHDLEAVSVDLLAFGVPVDGYSLLREVRDEEAADPAAALDAVLREVGRHPADADASPAPPTIDSAPLEPRLPRFTESFLLALLLVGPVVGALVAGAVLGAVALVRRPGAFAGGRAGAAALRPRAEREAAALAGELSAGRTLPDGLMPQAEAALMVMEGSPDALDLVGVLVLVRRARAALADPGAPVHGAPCRNNPLHGPGTASAPAPPGRKRRERGVRAERTSLCEGCAALPDDRRVLRRLELRGPDGVWRSYLDQGERAWIRHRFGAHDPARMVEVLLSEVEGGRAGQRDDRNSPI
ncbi:hypothetical protein [Nocardiopsis sp. CA-288880]|uniref:hypothetical protein n=1 Tax=Nocardiopsis sp. CA-288880 TaxID=3239995 RepID=UPI003D9588FB